MKNVGRFNPETTPSQIEPGRHCAVFRAGPDLVVELDDVICEKARFIEVVRQIAAVIARFRGNHPWVVGVAAVLVGAGAGAGTAQVQFLKLQYMAARLAPLNPAAVRTVARIGKAAGVAKAGGVLLLYVAIYIAVRWTSLIQNHKSARDGGVFITYGPPYFPLQFVPTIWPRGGYCGKRVERAVNAAQAFAQSIKGGVQSRVLTAKAKIPHPANFRRR